MTVSATTMHRNMGADITRNDHWSSSTTWTFFHLRGMCSTAPAMTAATFSRHCTSVNDDRAALHALSWSVSPQERLRLRGDG